MMSITVPIFFLVAFVFAVGAFLSYRKGHEHRVLAGIASVVLLLICVGTFVMTMVISIPAGHYGVATLFGDVQQEPYKAGLHFANPLYEWTLYDCRQKTHSEKAKVPSQDQLMTDFDVSIQYSIDGASTPHILQQTGIVSDVVRVHLVPKLRSILREQGKSVIHAEDFYKEDVQVRLQTALQEAMKKFLEPKGVNVDAVLLRDIQLPNTIRKGVEEKKMREQQAERQKAELMRFETEQQQKVAQAKAERGAAEEEAKMKMVLADARAYEIEAINKAVAQNPAYIKLEALKALQAISKDQAAKIYFLNGDSPNPLPLLHMGEGVAAPVK